MMQRALPIIAGLLRRTWFYAAVSATMCAGFAAHAASSLAAADDPGASVVHAPRVTPTRQAAHMRPDAGGLVARNMFCSTCALVDDPGPTDVSSPAFSGAEVVLIATEVAADPAVSTATVRVVPTDAQGNFALGDTIPRVGRIDQIARGWIDVTDRGGRHARLSLKDTRSHESAASGRGAATPATAAADPYADRVKQLDDHTYEVDRSLVRDLVGGVAKPGAVRAIPVVDNGEVKGIRLAAVTPGSIPTAIGLKSGDVLTTVDGAPLKTAEQVLELYAQLDQLSQVDLGLTRAGKPMALTLKLR
jgi:general secretion pathway protein C